jgi:hypothetical protein
MHGFIEHMQTRLDEKLDGDDSTPPDAPSLQDLLGG